jgi:monoamine oxidase
MEQIDQVLKAFESHVNASDLENPHLGPHAKYLDSITLKEWAERNFDTPLARKFAGRVGPAWLGAEADEMSALYLVDYVKSGTGVQNMSSDLKDGGQYLRNRQGK